jgi:2-succinyl-6-hydroxy-2,4-cyclohexadiene-1-carboxylate synthase
MAPTVLFLHGFTNTGASWDPVVAALDERYRLLAPDIRGHGSASDARPVTLDAVIGDVATLAPDRFTLVGYSQGGRIALHVALALAGRVERLVLISASPGIDDPAQRAARRAADEALADEIEGSTIEEFATRWERTSVLAGRAPEVAAAAHADRLRSTPARLASALRGLGTGALPSLWGRLGELSMPVTLIVGARDYKFQAIAAEMVRELARPKLVIVARAGHAVHLEAPEQVAAQIQGG